MSGYTVMPSVELGSCGCYFVDVWRVYYGENITEVCRSYSREDAEQVAAALNAADDAERLRGLLKRAKYLIDAVATDWTTVEESADGIEAIEEPGCGYCEEPHGHVPDCMAAALLADIDAELGGKP